MGATNSRYGESPSRRRVLSFAIVIALVSLVVAAAHFGLEQEQRFLPYEPLPRVEIFDDAAHLRSYRSSVDPELTLWMGIHFPPEPACVLVTAHGWHGDLGSLEALDPPSEYLVVDVDMRGREYSDGKPDLGGWELQDWIDAVEFALAEYSDFVSDPDCIYAEGGSGAGGNVYALVGKFPDYFSAAVVHAGMSDYHRLARKHSGYYGVCDDGAIEYGLGHIHPALTETGPEDVALNAHLLNAEMLARCADREAVYDQWRVGTAYENVQAPSLELKTEGLFGELGTCDGRLYDIQAGEVLTNMCRAVADSLSAVGAFEEDGAELEVTERADGYYRVALVSGSEADVALLARSVNELFSPIVDQRYVIPRVEVVLKPVWLSSLLPRVVGRYVCLKRQTVAVYHPLPEALGDSKQHAELFSDRWNEHVSPGRAVFTKRGQGEEVVVKARPKSQSVMEARCKLKSVWR